MPDLLATPLYKRMSTWSCNTFRSQQVQSVMDEWHLVDDGWRWFSPTVIADMRPVTRHDRQLPGLLGASYGWLWGDHPSCLGWHVPRGASDARFGDLFAQNLLFGHKLSGWVFAPQRSRFSIEQPHDLSVSCYLMRSPHLNSKFQRALRVPCNRPHQTAPFNWGHLWTPW